MAFYKYVPNSDMFECISPKTQNDEKVIRSLSEGRRLAENWKAFSVKRDCAMGPPGDFPSLYGDVPVFSQRAWDVLNPLLGATAEALPIRYPSETKYYAINVLDILDALDIDKSEVKRYASGKVMRVVRYAFHQEVLSGKHMFKIPETRFGEVLVSNEFRGLVVKSKLEGLDFKKLPE